MNTYKNQGLKLDFLRSFIILNLHIIDKGHAY